MCAAFWFEPPGLVSVRDRVWLWAFVQASRWFETADGAVLDDHVILPRQRVLVGDQVLHEGVRAVLGTTLDRTGPDRTGPDRTGSDMGVRVPPGSPIQAGGVYAWVVGIEIAISKNIGISLVSSG